jgi:nucleolar protein 56
VKIHYDWRLARVLDEDGQIVDEIIWDGHQNSSTIAERLRMIQKGRLLPEVRELTLRFPDAALDQFASVSDPSWPPVSVQESKLLHDASNTLAKMGIEDASGDIDRRLDMIVSSALEIRSSWTTLEARCIEWAGLFITEADLDSQRGTIPSAVSESVNIADAAKLLGVGKPKHEPSESEWIALRSLAKEVTSTSKMLSQHEDSIREISTDHLPSLSALMGPLSAAKLVVLAGGRERLARMPSGSLQVLGAHAAMSAHRRGAPPPKHGAVLFSMPQVSRSPRWVRGKIARFLAGKASIAVRVDHFGGEPWESEQIEAINREVEAIKAKFPKPPKRR